MEHSELLEPTVIITNKKGDILYRHKNKGSYFLFEICSENTKDNDEWESIWGAITAGARSFGIALLDYEEVIIESTRMAQSLGIEDDKPTSIEIPVFDHATRMMTKLNIRITATKELPEHLKDVEVRKG